MTGGRSGSPTYRFGAGAGLAAAGFRALDDVAERPLDDVFEDARDPLVGLLLLAIPPR
jgi:hypothetical protein